MPFTTTATLPLRTSNTRYQLPHRVTPYTGAQARLAGRSVMTPALDLDAYRFRAVVDWIEVKLHFTAVTHVHPVQQVLRGHLNRNSYITPLQNGSGGTFSMCKIRLQEPSSFAQVATICDALGARFGEASPSQVTEIEFSIDAYAADHTDEARLILLGAVQRTFWTNRDIWTKKYDRPRMDPAYRRVRFLSPEPDKARDEFSACNPECHHAARLDSTMYVGNKYNDVMHRIMDKTLDRQHPSGERDLLDGAQKRVRIEVRVARWELEKLGITDVASLRHFRLSSLQRLFFQFKLPTFDLKASTTAREAGSNLHEALRAETYLTAGVNALGLMDRAVEARRMKLAKKMTPRMVRMGLNAPKLSNDQRRAAPTVSWAEMNSKVNVALRVLDKKEQTAWRQRDERNSVCDG